MSMLIVALTAILVLNWGAQCVFNVLPRFQFSNVGNVPGLAMGVKRENASYIRVPSCRRERVVTAKR
ncbi:hypothetical protein PF008_g4464 [Phytophthora fragariae]|uniref:RxLR effector protein n=1 Tax=Phytophthora fragariae TaxID=53985 RepID=A0A6G0SC99_9STRA|nr:hypothetical protein PF008_g4464 [Phytophthora fragariae]